MRTKKTDQQFQILSSLVRGLDSATSVMLLNYMVGFLWRDENMYEAVAYWLKSKDEKAGQLGPEDRGKFEEEG